MAQTGDGRGQEDWTSGAPIHHHDRGRGGDGLAFRRHTLVPLDDCLYARQLPLPDLTRSALHRCLQRHGISRLPDVEGNKPNRQKVKRDPISFFQIDIAEVQTAEGKLCLFVGLDPIHQMPGLNTWRWAGTGA